MFDDLPESRAAAPLSMIDAAADPNSHGVCLSLASLSSFELASTAASLLLAGCSEKCRNRAAAQDTSLSKPELHPRHSPIVREYSPKCGQRWRLRARVEWYVILKTRVTTPELESDQLYSRRVSQGGLRYWRAGFGR
ncbi:hypothetical protein U9M48_013222 [Paspalum notatum var. saurae]|uniref:Uncharacterized protein n=1 Tax=Paspalum notatum var. saurae TaxID=547442 RepID=A0AAQ3T002_PASNO